MKKPKWIAVRIISTKTGAFNRWECRGCADKCHQLLRLADEPEGCMEEKK